MTSTETPKFILAREQFDARQELTDLQEHAAALTNRKPTGHRSARKNYAALAEVETELYLWEHVVGQSWDYATYTAVSWISDGSPSTSVLDNYDRDVQREVALNWIKAHKAMIDPVLLLDAF